MTISSIARQAERLITNNSPAILTAIGVTGTLTTAFLTGKASFKASEVIRDWEYSPSSIIEVETKEKVRLVWKLYIPAAGTGALTIAAIVFANRIGTRRAAAMAAAYSISDRAFTEYKDKILEQLGHNKEQAVRDEIAQDRINNNPPAASIIIGNGEVLCYDAFTDRYFMSSVEALKKAQNDTNYQVNNDWYASLSDFYNRAGLPTTSYSDDVGWNSNQLLELAFSTAMSPDGRPCVSITFQVDPVRDYYKHR